MPSWQDPSEASIMRSNNMQQPSSVLADDALLKQILTCFYQLVFFHHVVSFISPVGMWISPLA